LKIIVIFHVLCDIILTRFDFIISVLKVTFLICFFREGQNYIKGERY
jgi:hypothetical protein